MGAGTAEGRIAALAPEALRSVVASATSDDDQVEQALEAVRVYAASSARAALVARAVLETDGGGLKRLVDRCRRGPITALAAALRVCAELSRDADGARSCAAAGAHAAAAKIVCGEWCAEEEEDEREDASDDDDDDDDAVAAAAGAVIEAAGERFDPRPSTAFSWDEARNNVATYRGPQGRTILVRAVPSRQTEHADVGFVTWPASAVLAQFLLQLLLRGGASFFFDGAAPNHDADGASAWPRFDRALELGAGTGLVGLVAAAGGLAREVLLTDARPAVVENLRTAVSLNAEVLASFVAVDTLDFSKDAADADLILAADAVCCDDDARDLAACIARSLRRTTKAASRALVVLAGAKNRFGVQCFAPACQTHGLNVHHATLVPDAADFPLLTDASGYVPGMEFGLYTLSWPLEKENDDDDDPSAASAETPIRVR